MVDEVMSHIKGTGPTVKLSSDIDISFFLRLVPNTHSSFFLCSGRTSVTPNLNTDSRPPSSTSVETQEGGLGSK